MPTYDLAPALDRIAANVARHAIAPGIYTRFTGGPHKAVPNPYGCADAANILYTLGRFPQDLATRQTFVSTLQAFQDPSSGLFREGTHHDYHCTAHCIAALELFDARPLYPLSALRFLVAPGALENFLASLDWAQTPWPQSHQGAGVYAALALENKVPADFHDRYFAWLWDNADPVTGFWKKGAVPAPGAEAPGQLFPYLAGSFHYLFNIEYAHRPLRYPAAMVESCLRIWHDGHWPALGKTVNFAEIDWVFCLNRAVRQSGHRFAEAHTALHEFAALFLPFVTSLDYETSDASDDIHMLFGLTCCLAELQSALPGVLPTIPPLRQVLDRRPFI